jgi:hypothetical protein
MRLTTLATVVFGGCLVMASVSSGAESIEAQAGAIQQATSSTEGIAVAKENVPLVGDAIATSREPDRLALQAQRYGEEIAHESFGEAFDRLGTPKRTRASTVMGPPVPKHIRASDNGIAGIGTLGLLFLGAIALAVIGITVLVIAIAS